MTQQQGYILIFFGVLLILRSLKDTKWGWLWEFIKWTLLIVFTLIFADYFKKELKDWWERD